MFDFSRVTACSLCRTVSVLLSVTFVYCAKTSNHIFKLFHHLVATAFYFFRTKHYSNVPTGILTRPPKWGKNRDSRLIYGFGIDDWQSVANSFDRRVIYSIKRRRLFISQTVTHQWILFITASVDVVLSVDGYTKENRTEFNCTHTGKSEGEVTNNKRLRSRYCTDQGNYRQAQSRGLSSTAELLVFICIYLFMFFLLYLRCYD